MTYPPRLLQTPPAIAKKADAAIRFFEAQGRKVVGVAFKGNEYKIEFADDGEPKDPVPDLVTMSK